MNNLVVYGIGDLGKYIVDCFLKKKIKIEFIIDQFSNLKTYKTIPIKKIKNLSKDNKNANLLLALHNNYVDISYLYKNLCKYRFKKIYSLINFPNLNHICNFRVRHWVGEKRRSIHYWYWLNPNFKYVKHKKKINFLRKIFYDNHSKILLDNIIDYRDSGNISKCPLPSLRDQYLPKDLPKYRDAINYIDCGAHKGETIKHLSCHGVKLNSVMAFEPDKKNFKKLLLTKKKNYQFYRTGVFNKKCILKFNATGGADSSVILEKSQNLANTEIYLDKLDNYCKNFIPQFIKYDVEGSEIEALIGSKKTIMKCVPNLAVCLYHKPEHLFKIPLLIKSWNLNYRFYLRVHAFNTYELVLYCYNKYLSKY